MNFDFNTAFGKAVKTLIFVAVSGAISALIAFFTGDQDFFSAPVVGIINIVLVALKGVVDPKVKNI